MTTSTLFIPDGYMLVSNAFVFLFGVVLMVFVMAGVAAFLRHTTN